DKIVSSRYENQSGFLPVGRCRSLGDMCCHVSRVVLSVEQSCSKYKICLCLSCCLKVLYLGCLLRILSSGVQLFSIVCGHRMLELACTVIPMWLRSWMILKLVVCLLGPSIIGRVCCRILVADHKLFCSCWSLIRVVIPNVEVLLSLSRRLLMWCCNCISHMLRILYKLWFNIVLLGVDQDKWDLCFAMVRYLARILLHVDWGSIMLCRRYSIVEIMTVLMTYAICLSVIFLVPAMLARFRASSCISLVWTVCLLLSVNQQPRNLKG